MTNLKVALLTEGTYPFVEGGVSTWCDILCRNLSEIEYHIIAVTGNPLEKQLYTLPPNVTRVTQVPMWGLSEPGEFLEPDAKLGNHWLRKFRTSPIQIQQKFLPHFRVFLRAVEDETVPPMAVIRALAGMHDFWRQHDYLATMRSEAVWDTFYTIARENYQRFQALYPPEEVPSQYDFMTASRWLRNYLIMLNAPLPDVDICHATIASSVALVGVVAKYKNDTPLILTEHGIYLRERMLALSELQHISFYLRRFLTCFSQLCSRLCYRYADQVSPVCRFNHRWERLYGLTEPRLRTIYNGIDSDVFKPQPKPAISKDRPTVITAARVYPLKDILTLIRAANETRRVIPDVQFIVHGSITADPQYVQACRSLIAEFELENHFKLAGNHNKPSDLYNIGDISMLSSISEGFPYSVIEAMSCARPVVATDVGGVREALQGVGLSVRPRDYEALAAGAVRLLQNSEMCLEMGQKARQRVLDRFTLQNFVQQYALSYQNIHTEAQRNKTRVAVDLASAAIA